MNDEFDDIRREDAGGERPREGEGLLWPEDAGTLDLDSRRVLLNINPKNSTAQYLGIEDVEAADAADAGAVGTIGADVAAGTVAGGDAAVADVASAADARRDGGVCEA